jgi:hypothetical protein
VLLRDSEGDPLGGRPVTAELIVADEVGTTPSLVGTTPVTTATSDGENVVAGESLFSDLFIIGDFGFGGDVHTRQFKLRFTSPGATPLESGVFSVDDPTY